MLFLFVFMLFEKQNNMSFVKSVFYYLTDIVFGVQIMMCPKYVPENICNGLWMDFL